MTAPTAAPLRTTVAILGAGPAGLLLARLLHCAGIACVVLEAKDRAYVEQRQRAGILEQGTVDVLREVGAAAGMERAGLPHGGIELLFEGARHALDFPALTGGRAVMIYAQTEVCKDLIALNLAAGVPLLFDTAALGVDGAETDAPSVRFRAADGSPGVLACDYVAGCDGFWGTARAAFPPALARVYERSYPYAWLGILADVPPSADELVYARHARGFALLSMRSPAVSRNYLQVPAGTDADAWSDAQVWDELEARTATADGWRVQRGPVTHKSVTPMRSFVHEPMAHGRVFLAGDAAHIVPPTGAKGLNLAVGDVVTLARALQAKLAAPAPSDKLLAAYSDTCLARVWQAERFSYDMTNLLHVDPDGSPFDDKIQLARLRRIVTDPAASADLARAYTGFPF